MPRSISVLRAICILWALVVWPLAICLLFSCVTLAGAVFGIAALLIGAVPALAYYDLEHPWLRRCAYIALGLWLIMTGWLIWRSPDGHAPAGARVSNHFAGRDGWRYHRQALGALLPEVDQLMLGIKLAPITTSQAGSLSTVTKTIYHELEADADFHALGSVLPDAYNEWWGQRFDYGHYFLYVPPKLDKAKPAPALIFLHGSGGNFKAYTWLLSRVADELGMVLIAPSYGSGNWDPEQTNCLLLATLQDAGASIKIDPEHIHLAGLSNGAMGVNQAAVGAHSKRFHSLTFLSPVFDPISGHSPVFVAQWKGKSVLVITGREDDRVPVRYVEDHVKAMTSGGVDVDLKVLDGADHFLFFSHREVVIKKLIDWLKDA